MEYALVTVVFTERDLVGVLKCNKIDIKSIASILIIGAVYIIAAVALAKHRLAIFHPK